MTAHLGWFAAAFFHTLSHAAFAVAANPMGVDGQEFALKMAGSPTNFAQSHLQLHTLCDGMLVK